jgi:aspartyl protease family protein
VDRRALLRALAATAAPPSLRAAFATTAPAGAGAPLHQRHTGDAGALAWVEATLQGRRLRALVDSGASVSLVAPALAQALGLRHDGRTQVATLGGVQPAERVRLEGLSLGGNPLPPTPALALDPAAVLGPALGGIDGLLGMPVLAMQALHLDLAAGRLAIGPAPGPRAVMPLRWDEGLPVVELRLGDRAGASFLLDTGNAGALVVFAHHAERLLAQATDLPRLAVREAGGVVTAALALLDRVDAGAWTARDVPVAFETGSRARRGRHFDRLAGSLGLALFVDGGLALDAPASQASTAGPAGRDLPPRPGGFGAVLAPGDGGPVLAAVIDGGPAARAGLQPGDRLTQLDGVAAAGLAPHEVWQRLQGREAAEFGFERADGSAPRRLRLARERFFPRLR